MVLMYVIDKWQNIDTELIQWEGCWHIFFYQNF